MKKSQLLFGITLFFGITSLFLAANNVEGWGWFLILALVSLAMLKTEEN